MIAQKAVKEGMSTDLYGLVRMEKIRPELLTPESIAFLRKFDKSRLYNTTIGNSSVTLLIDQYRGNVIATGTKYILLRTRSRDDRHLLLALRIKGDVILDEDGDEVIDGTTVISSDCTERKIEEILDAVAIEAKSFHISGELNRAIVQLRLDADFEPIVVDTYELY